MGNVPACAAMVKRIKCIERIDRTVGSRKAGVAECEKSESLAASEPEKRVHQKIALIPNCIVRGPVAVLV